MLARAKMMAMAESAPTPIEAGIDEVSIAIVATFSIAEPAI
jgi:uncharacterized protein YggE